MCMPALISSLARDLLTELAHLDRTSLDGGAVSGTGIGGIKIIIVRHPVARGGFDQKIPSAGTSQMPLFEHSFPHDCARTEIRTPALAPQHMPAFIPVQPRAFPPSLARTHLEQCLPRDIVSPTKGRPEKCDQSSIGVKACLLHLEIHMRAPYALLIRTRVAEFQPLQPPPRSRTPIGQPVFRAHPTFRQYSAPHRCSPHHKLHNAATDLMKPRAAPQ